MGIAFDIVDAVAADPAVSITALAERVGIAKSTASRTCTVLVERGILDRTDRGELVLGFRCVELGELARLRRGISSTLHRVLSALGERVRETVQLAVCTDDRVTYVERVEADRRLRYTAERYRSSAVHTSSCGKVFAAWDDELARRCLDAGLRPETGRTIVIGDLWFAELHQVRRQGFATQVEEKEIGAASLAVPVRISQRGPVVAAVGMAGPVPRIVERRAEHVTSLRSAATEIGRLIADGEIALPTSG